MIHNVSDKAVKQLLSIGIFVAEIDKVIDMLRIRFNVHVYNSAAPFVTKRDNKNIVLYGYAVKYCSLAHGWNARELIVKSIWSRNIYTAKRQAINIAIKWILSHKSQEKCQIKQLSKHASKQKK